jgi:tRNA A-37 threonylcarbamoyl transferase component Bud32
VSQASATSLPPSVASREAEGVRLLVPGGGEIALPHGFAGPGYAASGEAPRLGRGGARVLRWPDGSRCYYREFRHGGWLGRLLGGAYGSDRPLRREIEDSLALLARGVDVARPVVGRVEGRWLLRLALVTEAVEGQTLADLLAERQAGGTVLRALRRVGELCARLHAAGFRHKDLHPGNVIVRPDGAAVVLDLAGGSWGGKHGDGAAQRSLVRMARYVEKHLGAPPPAQVILALLQGYERDRAMRHAAFRDLADVYERRVRWHRWLWGRRGWQRAD